MTGVLTELGPDLARAIEPLKDRMDLEAIEKAYRVSLQAHHGQKRLSGDDFISHSIAVASILAELQMDSTSIIAALLHDVVEDSDVTLDDIRAEFGPEVAAIVDGLTKISHLPFHSSTEEQVENYRKLLLSIAKDVRVIILKLADRLHNMRTLEPLPTPKRQRIALETREIYAPLAHRFGMAALQAELEDLAFKYLESDEYTDVVEQLRQEEAERELLIDRLRTPLEQELARAGIERFEVTGRPKHLWSIYRKMRRRQKPLDEIYDLMAMRVLVETIPDCYHALGVIHHRWTPLQERIKDYIASPKSNGYQSLHTTVFGPGGQLYEIQIRTRRMHHTAEFGIAAHWIYKEAASGRAGVDELDRHFLWFRQLLELQQDTKSPEEFLEFLKIDLYQDEIFVFTPKGDVKRLPVGATPIDFAFAVHTEVGVRCRGARINGRIAPLHRALRNGDTVEVLTAPGARPSRDWLSHVKTGRARLNIRQWIRQEEHESSVALGQEILGRELKRRRLELPKADELLSAAQRLSLSEGDQLAAALGRGDVPIGQVIRALHPDLPPQKVEAPKPTRFGRVIERLRVGRGVKVHGVGGLLVRYAQCCQPVPGDPVVGFVTKGRGISIHRSNCANLLTLPPGPERRVEIDWHDVEGDVFTVRVSVVGEDRRGLYADLMQVVSQSGINIRSAELFTRDGQMYGTVDVEVENRAQLLKIMRQMSRVPGVNGVERQETSAHITSS